MIDIPLCKIRAFVKHEAARAERVERITDLVIVALALIAFI